MIRRANIPATGQTYDRIMRRGRQDQVYQVLLLARQRLFSKKILAPNSLIGLIDLGEGVERDVGNEEKEGL